MSSLPAHTRGADYNRAPVCFDRYALRCYGRSVIAAAILIGFAANVDNLSLGIAYGIQRRPIRLTQNFLIAIATTTVTFAALLIGQELHQRLLSAVPNWVSGMMLILLAIAGLLRPRRQDSETVYAGAVGWTEIALLAASLSVNNIGLAIAGGFADLPQVTALVSVFCFSIALLSAGQSIARRATERLSGALTQSWIGNVVLLATGVMVLFGL